MRLCPQGRLSGVAAKTRSSPPTCYINHHLTSELSLWLLCQVKVHLVADVFALWVQPLQDLGQHVDSLLAAQPRALCLELLQEVFGGHRFPDQVPSDCFLRQLHVAAAQRNPDVFIYSVLVSNVRGFAASTMVSK